MTSFIQDIEEQNDLMNETNVAQKGSSNGFESSKRQKNKIWKNDYYNWISNAKEVRPITITEDLEWGAMTCFQKLLWWVGMCIQMLTLTILSLRTDRLLDWDGYLKHHWKHYSGRH